MWRDVGGTGPELEMLEGQVPTVDGKGSTYGTVIQDMNGRHMFTVLACYVFSDGCMVHQDHVEGCLASRSIPSPDYAGTMHVAQYCRHMRHFKGKTGRVN